MVKPCTQCGRCCTDPSFMGSMQANADDIKRWRRQKRHDILMWAYIYGPNIKFAPFADLWISPRTNTEAERCPFVRKVRNQDRYTCTIYETRPQVCRDYPWHVSHMKAVDCDMLEPGDTDADVERFMRPASSADQ
jgi:Fe-S-cluster containining protein